MNNTQYNPKKSNLGSEIYSGAATFGKIRAWIGVVISVIISAILLYLGIQMVMYVPKRTVSVNANVVDDNKMPSTIKCVSSIVDKGKTVYSCSFKLMYKINNIDYILPFTSTSNTFNGLSSTTLYSDPNNINDIPLTSDDTKSTGYICIGIAVFITIISLIFILLISITPPFK